MGEGKPALTAMMEERRRQTALEAYGSSEDEAASGADQRRGMERWRLTERTKTKAMAQLGSDRSEQGVTRSPEREDDTGGEFSTCNQNMNMSIRDIKKRGTLGYKTWAGTLTKVGGTARRSCAGSEVDGSVPVRPLI